MQLIGWLSVDPRFSAPTVLDPKGAIPGAGAAVVPDYYCPDPDCDCRVVVLVVRDIATHQQLAAIAHGFDAVQRQFPGGPTRLSQDLAQGPDAAAWLALVKSRMLATRAQVAVFEARYLEAKAAAIDPTAPAHHAVRSAAGLAPLPYPETVLVERKGRRATGTGRRLPPPRDLAAEVAPVLPTRNLAEHLSGAELLALAMALTGAPKLTGDAAAEALLARGLARQNPRRLAARIAQSARDTAWFARPEEDAWLRPPRAMLERYVDGVLARPDVAAVRPPAPKPEAKAPPPAPKPEAKAPARAAAKPAPAPPPAPVVPAVAPPPPFAPAARPRLALDPAALAREDDAPPGAVEGVRLALDAWRLASAAQFDELLAVATLRDVTPHRYQTETVRRVLRALRGRAILADEVGLGKTVEAIMVLREYQARGMVRRALILVPAPLVAQWAGELAQKAGVVARTTDDERSRAAPEAFWSEPGVVVASLALARGARHAPLVQAEPWDLVVVDEAHHIKNRATLGYKLVSALRRRFLLLVTATPVENDLEEIYNLVTLLRPGQFDTPAAFRRRFVDPKDPTRPRDRDALRALLAEVMVRNTRAQSGLALPPRLVTTVAVDPSPAERALYEAVVAFVRAWHDEPSLQLAATALLLEAGSSPRAVRATVTRMRAKRAGKDAKKVQRDLDALAAAAGKVEGTRKGEALLQVLAARRDPVLVFTRYRETLDEVVAQVGRAGVDAVAFHGGMDERARSQALARFRAGGAVVMVATAAGSEGHNLQHCNVLVNFDLPWNPMAIEQRIGRLHRMGQTREVHVYNLCARGTLEERVLDVLDRRVQLFQLVVGEMDMVLGNLADERDLEDWLVAAVARARSEAEVDAAFDRLADELLAARGRYEKTRALDDALFGQDFEA